MVVKDTVYKIAEVVFDILCNPNFKRMIFIGDACCYYCSRVKQVLNVADQASNDSSRLKLDRNRGLQ